MLTVVLLLLIFSTPVLAGKNTFIFLGTITQVENGVTVLVSRNLAGREVMYRIRINGLQKLEQADEAQAVAWLESNMIGKEVKVFLNAVSRTGSIRYGRHMKNSLASNLLLQGLAKSDTTYRAKYFEILVAKAKEANKGIWRTPAQSGLAANE